MPDMIYAVAFFAVAGILYPPDGQLGDILKTGGLFLCLLSGVLVTLISFNTPEFGLWFGLGIAIVVGPMIFIFAFNLWNRAHLHVHNGPQ